MEKRTQSLAIKKVWKYSPLYLMMLPGIVYLIINNYLPMFGLAIAFKDINFAKGIWGSDWVGFQNFKFLFQTSDAYEITRNTILYNAAFIVIGLVVAVGFAILLNEIKSKFASRLYQSLIILPFLISMVLVSYLVFSMLSIESGFMNKTILPLLGMDPISWYNEPKYWPVILTLVHTWKGAGYACIIYLAAIIGIDPEYYEAATLDGASKWQQIRMITIPLITPVIIMLTLLQIGRIFYSDFGLFYQVPMNAGALFSTTNVIDTYVFRGLLQLGNIGMSSAAGFYQSFVGFFLVIISNYVVRKINKENALF
ncbi:putative aldouronate transport system permease protein [Paenibacillus sp. UNCCL117]|uniref:ABC transporter permease n=1 Tax=unclassified Paenibacillus TaxID=185978 RepID=UPI0008908DB3|nr:MULTISPECIES: ABC transporter permease subunit [unclassified Paenibacillus]SDD04530.1 putative aldouronate transport system permease protein [Paenibacillus sp. cl123]SFW32059.1 putative aldouronate transport system permease protein [Paenibacillus sp. UNCCL117]